MMPFRELTRLGQLRRMRRLAESALAPYGLTGARLTFIRYWANVTYRVDLPGKALSGSSLDPHLSSRFLLRVLCTNHWEAVKGEMTWLAALSQEAGLPVPEPVSTLEGELLTRISTPEMPEGRIVSLMRWIDGRVLTRELRPAQFRTWGQMVAGLHRFAASWQPPEDFERFVWDWAGLLGGRGFGCTVEELVATMPEHLQEPFQVASHDARSVMENLGTGSDAYGLIHADMCQDNILFKGGEVYAIDFEDCGFGYWLWDIAVALCQRPWTEDWFRQRDAFLEGYTQVHTLPESQLRHLDLFVAMDAATAVLWGSLFMKNEPQRRAEHGVWRDEGGAKLVRYADKIH